VNRNRILIAGIAAGDGLDLALAQSFERRPGEERLDAAAVPAVARRTRGIDDVMAPLARDVLRPGPHPAAEHDPAAHPGAEDDAEDDLVPAANADFAERTFPAARLEVRRLPAAGHFVLWQQPELIVDAIRDCSNRGGLILDPFGGAGTTLIAAERTGRRARVIELDPTFVDVSIERWQRLTGGTAIHADTGLPFARAASTITGRR